MKKLVVALLISMPVLVFAQVKPNLAKAEKALRDGKIDEAKTIIDATVGSQDFMVDKKGAPSKNAAKAWFMKGLIYAAMDTTSKAEFKTLDPKPFAVAKEAFEKAKEIDGGKTPSMVNDINGFPMMTENVYVYLAQKYFSQAVTAYQEKKDYKKAFEKTEETLYFIPKDTSILMNAGIFFAPAAEEHVKAIDYLRQYIALGGRSTDAYALMFSIYRDKLKDNDKALAVAQEAVAKFPNNVDFPKYELDMYIKMNRLPDAKVAMEKQVKNDPNDKESRYFLGVINLELGNKEEARKWYEEAIKLDPKYFEPHLGLADLVFTDAKMVKQQMNQLGITADDKKKRFELDKVYVDKLKAALPYWEACEKLNPDEGKVLDTLLGMYSDLDMQPQVARITKHMKTLGLLD